MISPFAPLFPWLLSAIMFDTPMCVRPNGQRARLVSIQRTRANGPTQYKFAEHRPTWTNETPDLDLRHGPTRYAVLRALHDVGHSCPWALGAPWSPLTDEQAGRATAAILRAVGEDPSKPVGVVPVCVLSPWLADQHGQSIREPLGTALWSFVNDYGWHISEYRNGRHYRDITGSSESHATPDNTGDAGRLAADNAARALGCLMIEDLTPT